MGLAEIAEPLDERVEIDPGPVHTRKDIFGKALDAYMKVPADLGMAYRGPQARVPTGRADQVN